MQNLIDKIDNPPSNSSMNKRKEASMIRQRYERGKKFQEARTRLKSDRIIIKPNPLININTFDIQMWMYNIIYKDIDDRFSTFNNWIKSI